LLGRLVPKSQFSGAYRTFLDILTAARKEAGLTQTELAERIGRRQTHISIIETGVRRLDLIEFCALARAMETDPVKLFERVYRALPDDLDI
jgi:transcriptional regulator with XRE-family HTH domain